MGDAVATVGHGVENFDTEWLRRFAAHDRCSPFDGFDWLHVAGFSVEDAAEHVAYLVLRRVGIAFDEGERAQHHGWSVETRLHGSGGNERPLDRMHVACGDVQRLDSCDCVPVGLRGQHHVGRDQDAVEQHTGRSGLTCAGTEPDTHEP